MNPAAADRDRVLNLPAEMTLAQEGDPKYQDHYDISLVDGKQSLRRSHAKPLKC
jgi:hypothetical protein